jgi:hypothetical protein
MRARLRIRSLAASVAVFCFVAGSAGAQPEPWQHPDGSIHYYHAVAVPHGIDWSDARDTAQVPGGYLATLTSQAENDFVFGLVDSGVYRSNQWSGPWLGGYQPAGSIEPDSGWRWLSPEPFGYRNWALGEPDNGGGGEDALCFGGQDTIRRLLSHGAWFLPTWDDRSAADSSMRGYVLELSADTTTVGLLQNDSSAFAGYTLLAPMSSWDAYLIDNKGRLGHSWRSRYRLATAAYLLQNGYLLRVADLFNQRFRNGGRVELLDWDGNLVWSYDYSDSLRGQHHDAIGLPNGNVLMVAYELKTAGEAIAAGRNPQRLCMSRLYPEHLIEVNPATNSIVWEWHLWDHLVQDFDSTRQNYGAVGEHPELVDVNYLGLSGPHGFDDWIHANSVDYNAELDQVMLSARNLGELWVIDHSTTVEQARGHAGGRQGMGGDILYRWGNPQTYRAGTAADQKFFGQHNAQWIRDGLPGAGHIMVYNNGYQRPASSYSTLDEFLPTADSTGHYPRPLPGTPYGPAQPCWMYGATPPTDFYSSVLSGAQRLPNGNTLTCEGVNGRYVEVTRDSQIVWQYVSPMSETVPMYQGELFPHSLVFQATRYAPDYPGLAGRNLTPGYPLERYRPPLGSMAEERATPHSSPLTLSVSPNPARPGLVIVRMTPGFSGPAAPLLSVFDISGRLVLLSSLVTRNPQLLLDARGLRSGVYVLRLEQGGIPATQKLVIQ